MRALHVNPRKFQEPFVVCLMKHLDDGFNTEVIQEKITVFGSIMNKGSSFESNSFDTLTNVISIKINYQNLGIKTRDRVIYNGDQYIISSIEKDIYSRKEINIIAIFEKPYVSESAGLEMALEGILYG